MPSVTAKRQCPDLIFVKPRFEVYKARRVIKLKLTIPTDTDSEDRSYRDGYGADIE
jgi:nucleotidyltransferase/DNA polymerase involved in DNA repair